PGRRAHARFGAVADGRGGPAWRHRGGRHDARRPPRGTAWRGRGVAGEATASGSERAPVRRAAFWGASIALLGLLVVAAVLLGTVSLQPSAVAAALLGSGDSETLAIVRTLRLPRAALALLVGAALGIAGAALQGSLRNP